MSMVDTNYGVGNYRGLNGSRRAGRAVSGKICEGSRPGKHDRAGLESGRSRGNGRGTETAFARSMADMEAELCGGNGNAGGPELCVGNGNAGGPELCVGNGNAGGPELCVGNGNAAGSEKAAEAAASAIWGADTETKDKKDMSLAEYTWYIDRLISQMARRGYSRGNSVFVYISEEGYRAMQADPEYEAWVLNSIRASYQFCRGMGGHDGYHSAHFFGASKEEYRGQSWHSGCSKCEQDRRQEQKRLRKKRLQALLKKRREQKWLEKQRLEKLRLERLRLEKAVYKRLVIKDRQNRKRLEEEYREEALARREAASAFRIYQALARYNEQ